MFEYVSNTRSPLKGALRALAFSACGVLVSFGLCGIDSALYPNSELAGSFLGLAGAAIGLISGFSLCIAVLMLLWAALMRLLDHNETEH